MKKPLIGITLSMDTDQSYHRTSEENVQAIVRAGGIPVLLPNLETEQEIEELSNTLDGLYATGGDDINPILYGEEPIEKLGVTVPKRDHFELTIIKQFLSKGKPFLGVCRGMQMLNVATGGDLYQDIHSKHDQKLIQHTQKTLLKYGAHFVDISTDSLLYKIIGKDKITVNSLHHQSCRNIDDSFQVSGKASDGIVESIESKKHDFALGIQWHPESMLESDDGSSLKIYQEFIQACKVHEN